ncbi:MAG: DUF4270 family protein, partial [Balneolaceae bacterium]|nr:DUF4270 family protein [Balneolaceae bacterium]
MMTAQFRATASGNALFLCCILVLFALLAGCENPGIVGEDFSDTNTAIVTDTVAVENLETKSYRFFSGNLSYFTIGKFTDPLFGEMTSTGLIRPQLVSSSETVAINANIKLRLVFQQSLVYGDSTQPAEFDIVELDQRWRGNAWKLDDEPQLSNNPPVASFTVEKQDSMDIEMSDTWVQKYTQFAVVDDSERDSLFRLNFPGLAIVAKNDPKMLPVNAQSSKFIIENPESDTIQVNARDWAYSLERNGVPDSPAGTSEWHSTFENIFTFDMDLTRETIGTANPSRVMLVLYEDQTRLKNSIAQVSATAKRADIPGSRLQILDQETLPITLQTGPILSSGTYNKEDGSYRFNITTFVNSILVNGLSPELK